MATRKFSKSRPRKTVRRHRHSTIGRVKVPLDVRSKSDLPKFRQALKNKGLTIILVYATWCPHCHTIMPHFDAAAKSPNNTITPIKINETMVDSVNDYIKRNINHSAKPISVNGYPSIILVNKNAEKITDIEPVRNTESLKKVMENAGPLANNAGLTKNNSISNVNRNAKPNEVINSIVETEINIPKNNKNKNEKNFLGNIGIENKGMANGAKNVDVGEDELLGSIASESNKPKNNSLKLMNNKNNKNNKNKKLNLEEASAPSPLNSFSEINEKVNVKAPSLNNKEAEEIMSLQSPIEGNEEIKPIMPPSPIIENDLEPAEKLSGGGRRGGSLMSAMARTTYALAPAAALLATAAMVMKGKHRKTRKSTKKSKKSLRRRR
jgi:thiol-disulfide isomerase/thioredoxin